MSDEIKTEEKKEECKCFCRSEGVKKFVIVALGSFVGVFCALSLFAALHRPPVMPPCAFGPKFGPPPCQTMMHHPRFDRGRADFQKKVPKDFGQRAPFEAQKPEINR